MSHGAIVLAAGSSDRMGSSKPLLKMGDQTFLEHILDDLDAVPEIGAVVVVLGAKAAAIRDATELGRAVPVTHRGYKEGMFSSVRAGARAVLRKLPNLEGALVCLVDMPIVKTETYATIVRAFQTDRDDVVIAAHRGEGGHPVLLSRALVARLADVAQAAPAEDTLAEFLEAHAERRRYVDAQDPAVLININTPDLYREHFGAEASDA
ncbi:MAG: nucleotidyltransferase family protein [Candidatus Eiseniibacteriota bacterium]